MGSADSLTSQVDITKWHKNQAVVLYYKGDILTLWLFLGDVFERYDELTLCSCNTLSNTPHLAYLLLLRVECRMLIHDLSATLDKQLHEDWRFTRDFFTITQIIRTQSIEPELKAKAMAMRIMMTIDSGRGTVSEIWHETITDGDHSQNTFQTKVIQEAKQAIRIHKEHATHNGSILRFTRAYVNDGLRISKLEAANTALNGRLLDRGDLYFSYHMLVAVIEAAVTTDSSRYLRLGIRYAEESRTVGEWGAMFTTEWWLTRRLELIDTEVWKRATEGGVWGEHIRERQTSKQLSCANL